MLPLGAVQLMLNDYGLTTPPALLAMAARENLRRGYPGAGRPMDLHIYLTK